MGVIGFGAYRVSVTSRGHYEALELAIKDGVKLIDTSSNYTDGESEELVGAILNDYPNIPVKVISKVGYIQGKNLDVIEELNKNGKAKDDLVVINEHLKHSIHPEFIENQLELSLKRMDRPYIDYYLLHNPEYFLKTEAATQDEYYRRIEKAFIKLEELCKTQKIGAYGISSNTFVSNSDDFEFTDLTKVLEIAKKIKAKNFKMIQFPMNLIELGALHRQLEGRNLIEVAKENGLITVINRPLNAFSDHGLVRLAEYDKTHVFPTFKEVNELFELCKSKIDEKWKTKQDGEGEDIWQIPLLKQVKDIWTNLPTPDAVDQVFHGHFFPFLANLWGEKGLSAKEAEPFFKMYETAEILSRKVMDTKAKEFRRQAIQGNLIPDNPNKTLSQLVIEKYFEIGVDYVLVGMKKMPYVEQLKTYF
ncbi:MAG: aldo/keto reductase [Halobacteriovoraceae bacterium]|nr:aldo/keto reductase [Halobacteriovoraceae bacterium]